MIKLLLFLSAFLILTLGVYLLTASKKFLLLMNEEEPEENIQFLRRFAKFYILLSLIGFIVASMDLNLFSLCYIFGLLMISAIFASMFVKKIK